MKRFSLLTLIAIFGLTSCSTLEQARRILPFQESDEARQLREQGISPDSEKRISVLLFEQTLAPNAELAGFQIVLPVSYMNDDWPQAGAFPSNAPHHLQGSTALDLKWKKNAGAKSSNKGRVMAPPVIAGKQVYVMDAKGTVRALDRESGRNIWRKKLKSYEQPADKQDRQQFYSGGFRGVADKLRNRSKEGYGGGMAVSGGRLFVTSGHRYMLALDVNTGEEIWRTATPTPMHAAPVFADGRLFAVSQDNELFGFDSESGQIIWTFQGIVEPARILSSSAPAIYGEILVSPFASGELGGFRVQNGRQIWSDSLTRSSGLTALSEINDVAASPVIFDNTVYAISHSGILVAVDLKTGERIWSQQVGGIHMPWVAGNTIFVVSNDGQVAAVSRADGRVIWVQELPAFKNEKKRKKRIAWAGPVLASGNLILVSSRGDVVLLSPQNGEIVKQHKFRDRFFIPPVIAGGVVYLISDKAKLYALQ